MHLNLKTRSKSVFIVFKLHLVDSGIEQQISLRYIKGLEQDLASKLCWLMPSSVVVNKSLAEK